MKKTIVIVTGAGISQESGIPTFRDKNGLWEQHDIDEVSSINGWNKNPKMILDFHNDFRRKLKDLEPNEGHKHLVHLEEKYDVHIITQNIDDLHERAGSKNIIHIHGNILEASSSKEENNVRMVGNIGYEDINIGDLCPNGHQLRPNVVFFGEGVQHFGQAEELAKKADIFMIIGTSMVVYPASGLVGLTRNDTPIYVIDPKSHPIIGRRDRLKFIKKNATEGVKEVVDELMNRNSERVV